MKTLLIITSLLILSINISCTAYESDAHEFIQSNGTFEDNKVVISSTDSFEEAFCIANNPNYKEFIAIDKHVVTGSQSELSTDYHFYKNSNETKAKVSYITKNLNYTCLFNLKEPDFSAGNIQFIINEGLQSLLDAHQ